MSLLPDPILAIPDWSLKSDDYPAVFLVDNSWSETDTFTIERYSRINTVSLSEPGSFAQGYDTDHHGEKTRHVIQSIAGGLLADRITLVSVERANVTEGQPVSNLFEALMSVQVYLNPGDLVVINVGSDGGLDSFADDLLIARQLRQITDLERSIIVIAAGNTVDKLAPTLAPDVVVVGGVDENGVAQSRYGQYVTCYGVVPYDLPGYPGATFGRSSAATAYTAGMVLMMLNYARSNGLTLTSKQVANLLKANGTHFQVVSTDGTSPAEGDVPDWNKLRPAIDVLVKEVGV